MTMWLCLLSGACRASHSSPPWAFTPGPTSHTFPLPLRPQKRGSMLSSVTLLSELSPLSLKALSWVELSPWLGKRGREAG